MGMKSRFLLSEVAAGNKLEKHPSQENPFPCSSVTPIFFRSRNGCHQLSSQYKYILRFHYPTKVVLPHAPLVGQPFATCGCRLVRHLAEYQVCLRCSPPRGYHTYRERVDACCPTHWPTGGNRSVLPFGACDSVTPQTGSSLFG